MRLPLSLLVLGTLLPAQATPDLYDVQTLRTFYFTFASPSWYTQLSQARTSQTDVAGDLTVDGTTYRNVGVRFRGNSSYSGVGTKKSINVTMDAFVPGQKLLGYDSLNLSNGFNDPTFCREVISYGILRKYLPAPKANYVRVFVNNAYFGLYVNVQQPDGKFIKEWYQGNRGNRYRCDPPSSAGRGNSALQWLGTTLANYQNAYELKTDPTVAVRPWEDVRLLCNVLNNTGNAQLPAELPKVLDVDQALWYLATNIVMVNLDSYVDRGNDYYLYHDTEHDKMMLLPWDMNESFGGYAAGMSISRRLTLSPFYNEANTSRPLLGQLFGVVPEWRARYFHHVREIVDRDFHWNSVGPLVARYQALIDAAVRADPNLIYSYQAFQANVTTQMFVNSGFFRTEIPGLKQICDGRQAYIQSLPEYRAPRPDIASVVVPRQPPPNTAVTITARVTGTAPLGDVTLYYRGVGTWQSTAMLDDGNHGDGAANDGVFGAFVPAATQRAGSLVDYYIGARSAAASGGAASYFPATAAFGAPAYLVGFATRPSPLTINEVLAINTSGVRDEKLEYEDWLELHNTSASPVAVGGMYLTDDPLNPTQWQIPAAASVPAGGALLIWCDAEPLDGPLHATFKLSGSGEQVWLFDTDGKTLLSTLEFGPQTADISIGRLFDGRPAPLVAYKQPTPAAPNSLPCSAREFWPVTHTAHRFSLQFLGTPRIGGAGTAIRLTQGPRNGSVLLYLAPTAGDLDLGQGLHVLLAGGFVGPFPLPTDATGTAAVPVTLPNDPNLKGTALYLQAVGADLQGATLSNGVEVRICN